MNRRLLIATGNRHKTGEIRDILGAGWQILDLSQFPDLPPVEETGSTFEENARLKATAASLAFDGLVLADDSGLEVDALGGRPGVRSARFAGPDADDAANRALLLSELRAIRGTATKLTARFRCAIALALGGRIATVCDGTVTGTLLDAERGEGGFGYDPLFVPDGFQQTFAELSAATKNRISHRARALAAARAWLERFRPGASPAPADSPR